MPHPSLLEAEVLDVADDRRNDVATAQPGETRIGNWGRGFAGFIISSAIGRWESIRQMGSALQWRRMKRGSRG